MTCEAFARFSLQVVFLVEDIVHDATVLLPGFTPDQLHDLQEDRFLGDDRHVLQNRHELNEADEPRDDLVGADPPIDAKGVFRHVSQRHRSEIAK